MIWHSNSHVPDKLVKKDNQQPKLNLSNDSVFDTLELSDEEADLICGGDSRPPRW